jgi:sigma-B regulation protein RsbU (phosphoserine phosphatase)
MENYSDNAPCCLFSFTDNGELAYVNQSTCAAVGYGKDELVGRKLETIFPVATKIFYNTHFFPLLKMQGHADEIFIFLLTREGNQLPVLLNATRTIVNGAPYNHCACIIVHNRRKYEDELVMARRLAETMLQENTELKKAKDDLTRQSVELDVQIQLVNRRNHELKQLNRAVTHDLQEPIRKMMVFVNILNDLHEADPKQKDRIQRLLKIVQLMRETISGLQQYVWLGEASVQPQSVDLSALLEKARLQLKAELSDDLLELRSERLPVILADDEQLYLLMYQVLSNAVHFRKPGKKATVSVTATILKKNRFKAVEDRYQYEDYLKIDFRDEGLGFEPEYNHQVFELFRKLHHLNRRGLGLSYCRLIAENHGGWIEAEGRPLVGTTISVFLPAASVITNHYQPI